MPSLRLRLLAAWGQSRRLLGTSVGLSHPLRGTPVGLSHPLRGTSVAAKGARCPPRADRVPANLAGTRARTYSALPTAAEVPARRPRARVEAVGDDRRAGSVNLTWNSGDVTCFPYVWLRDSCLCHQCYHPSTLSRRLRIDQLDVDITPEAVENDPEPQQLKVTWPDGHVSRYPHQWLAHRSFSSKQLEERRLQQAGPMTRLWDLATIERSLFRVDYAALMANLDVLRETLQQLAVYGLLVVTGSPRSFGVVEELTMRLGHTRTTHYGRTFRVTTKLAANNLAYTNETLLPHADLPYYEHVPGVQVLHCIQQHVGDGGENTLVDSFYVAELIRQQRPDLFQLLASVPVEFVDVGVESQDRFHKVQEHPVFRLNKKGHVTQTCVNNPVRSYRLNAPLALVKPMYEALRLFHDLCVHKSNHLLYKMDDGDMLVFNNRRVLHGRLGYSVTEASTRMLEGAYVDWDEIMCRLRTVQELTQQEDHGD